MISNNSAQSYLIDSNAWDTICRKISGKDIMNSSTWGNYYNNTTTKYESINTLFANHRYNSTNGWTVATQYRKGNVTGEPKGEGDGRLELATGASEDFKAYNIYDMAGNIYEWTTEISTDNHATMRGGSFDNNGSSNAVVCSNGDGGINYYYINVGFRVVLYLK